MKYLQSTPFSVPVGGKKFSDGWEATFGKKAVPEPAPTLPEVEERWKKYARLPTVTEMVPWSAGLRMDGVSVSAADLAAGSPKEGDMVARNPKNPADRWLIAAKYFSENFVTEPIEHPDSDPEPYSDPFPPPSQDGPTSDG
jgi:hypothetical protein